MTMIADSIDVGRMIEVLRVLFDAVEVERTSDAMNALRLAFEAGHCGLFPRSWIEATISSMKAGRFDDLARPFADLGYVGDTGFFLIVAPYTIRREGKSDTRLSAMFGRVAPHSKVPDLSAAIITLFGRLDQPVPRVLPIEVLAAAGNLRGDGAEAFIVPDGFEIPGSYRGAALNNMPAQRRRVDDTGRVAVARIFEPESCELLLSPFATVAEGDAVRHLEYQLHDGGHASGLGLECKLANDLLSNYYMRGIEEWRADGVAFALADSTMSAVDFGKVVASNFLTRFGVDAQRGGGMNADTDVNTAIFTFDHMLRSGEIRLRGGKIGFHNATLAGLAQATRAIRDTAIEVTRQELALHSPIGLVQLYSRRFAVADHIRALFDDVVVQPCRDLKSGLR